MTGYLKSLVAARAHDRPATIVPRPRLRFGDGGAAGLGDAEPAPALAAELKRVVEVPHEPRPPRARVSAARPPAPSDDASDSHRVPQPPPQPSSEITTSSSTPTAAGCETGPGGVPARPPAPEQPEQPEQPVSRSPFDVGDPERRPTAQVTTAAPEQPPQPRAPAPDGERIRAPSTSSAPGLVPPPAPTPAPPAVRAAPRAASAPQRSVTVTIGRIELNAPAPVKPAAPPSAPPPPRRRAPSPATSLDAYLESRARR
jgi:hypothetical protein